ncbi:cytochrome P450 [Lactarius hengduanensis]|nr:cytochrome P450 [Lactarius hengduanensis]
MATSSPPEVWSSPTCGKPDSSQRPTPANILTPLAYISQGDLHDPTTYPEPSKFKPERFLDPAARAQFPEAAFGFGRRKCPGRALALDAVWLAMASMLAVFEFLPATDGRRPAPPRLRRSSPRSPFRVRCHSNVLSDRGRRLRGKRCLRYILTESPVVLYPYKPPLTGCLILRLSTEWLWLASLDRLSCTIDTFLFDDASAEFSKWSSYNFCVSCVLAVEDFYREGV